MKALLTGSTGFLGGYIIGYFKEIGLDTVTVGRSEGNEVLCDLSVGVPMLNESEQFDLVIHNAGLAHKVRKTEAESKAFFDVNVDGTKNLLEALASRKNKPKCFVLISTVAVYGLDQGEGIDETAELQGSSPYAKSKIEAEKLVQNWCSNEDVNCVILRLPLVVGENAPGNLGAMERAIKKGYYFRLGSGNARRSMVNAVDVAKLLPRLVDKNGIYHVTDGHHRSYAEMDVWLSEKHGKSIKKIPVWLGTLLAKFGDVIPGFPLNTYRLQKLEQSLTFDDSKARKELYWPL